MKQKQRFREELKKELKGETYTSAGSAVEKETSTAVIQTGESTNNVQANTDDVAEMGKHLLSRRKRKLLEAMQVHFFYEILSHISYIACVFCFMNSELAILPITLFYLLFNPYWLPSGRFVW
jgi:hypothetical protein